MLNSSPLFKPIFTLPLTGNTERLVDYALHTVLEKHYAHREIGAFARCADYDIVGARLLSVLTNHSYFPVAGGEIIDCGANRYVVLFPSRQARRRAKYLSEITEYHCWIESLHEVLGKGLRREIIDFTVRHDRQVANFKKVEFNVPNEATYFWGWSEDVDNKVPTELLNHPLLSGRKKGWMWCDDKCTKLLRSYEKSNDAFFSNLMSLALTSLADRIEDQSTYRPLK